MDNEDNLVEQSIVGLEVALETTVEHLDKLTTAKED